jgi:RNA polymerase sigma-70 factor, ECF subfamily
MATFDVRESTPPASSPDVALTRLFESEALPLRDELGRAARRYAKNAHDAEDLVQETFAKAWAGFGSFDPGTNLRAWMFRIMVNTWISAHRRAERRPRETLTESFTDAQLATDSRRFDTSPAAEVIALQRIPDEDLRKAVQALDPSLQRIVHHADLCQLSYREIAEIEAIPLGTVMSRIHRARRLLREALVESREERRPRAA